MLARVIRAMSAMNTSDSVNAGRMRCRMNGTKPALSGV